MQQLDLQQYEYWVLAPKIESDDPNLQYYYDFTQSIAEYTKVFDEMNVVWHWQPVSMLDFEPIIHTLSEKAKSTPIIIINLCDGDEINGAPGISVAKLLVELNLIFTGSDEYFYDVTTSKIPMKSAFDSKNVPNANWEIIDETCSNVHGIFNRLGNPLIIKPAISGGSMGLTIKNVVNTEDQLQERIQELHKGYRGWQLTSGGLFVEQFIKGREFTTFIIGSSDDSDSLIVYEPIERVFHNSLPDEEKFLSFDRLWETYEEESAMPNNEFVYVYSPVDEAMSLQLKKLSVDAYCAVKGQGYGRIDFRLDQDTETLYLLEVNAQCGLSEDENYTSIGAILKVSNKSFTTLIKEVLIEALNRYYKTQL